MSGPRDDARRRRAAELETLVERYQASYYRGEAEIGDAEFDSLWDELKLLSPESPVLARVGSEGPTAGRASSGVASPEGASPEGASPEAAEAVFDGFPKARHLIPMGSQEKAAKPEDFLSWAEKIKPRRFVVQHKLDGASLELQYDGGLLVRAVTRGDGLVGDDITRNARRMAGCVAELALPFSGGVRGEVVMPRAVWTERFPDKANCRNAANGLMRRKDGEGTDLLEIVCYDASAAADDRFFATETDKIAWLAARGFRTTETEVFDDAEAVVAYRRKVSAERPFLPYDIDGLVVKDIDSDAEDLRRARPERQIAFKFDLEEAVSLLRGVEWSESGATYTPIGVIDPVRLAGTTVQRANLNNPDMLRAMDLRIGSPVVVVKRGEIIPKIERKASAAEAAAAGIASGPERDIEHPASCAVCGAALVDAGTRLYCPNPSCPKRTHHRIEKWISVLDIREFGDLLLKRLFDAGRLESVSDLYGLSAEELAELDRMGELSAAKVVRSLRAPRRVPLAAFVAGFDLEGVGETIMEKVAAAGFDTLGKLRAASVEEIAAVHGLGEITARTIAEGLRETAADMDAVLAAGIVGIEPPPAAEESPLRGLSFCFTGELSSLKRSEAEARVKRLGGLAKSAVVKDLSFLVTNDPSSGSSKNEKARKLGVRILDEDAFLALLADPASARGAVSGPGDASFAGFGASSAPTSAPASAPDALAVPSASLQGDLFGPGDAR